MNFATYLLVPWLAPQITNLVESYPYGDQFGLELSSDGTRAFVAEGASIAMLNIGNPMSATEPTVVTRVEVPNCLPLSMLLYKYPILDGSHYLFIAGGSHGVWRIEFCPDLSSPCFGSPPQYNQAPTQIDDPVEANFERKRCVDVAVVAGSSATGGVPVLFALYAATSEAGVSAPGPTELRAYKLLADGTTPALGATLTAVTFPTTSVGAVAQAGSALTADPADGDSVYVAVGKGGIWRVDVVGGTTPTFNSTQILSFPFPSPSDPQIPLDNVRDLTTVRTHSDSGSRTILYAALNYGKVLEYDLSIPGSAPMVFSPGFSAIERIAAVSDGTSKVLLAVGYADRSGVNLESGAPFRPTGFWSTICIRPGIDDPTPPANPAPGAGNQIMFYRRDTSTSDPWVRVVDALNPTFKADTGFFYGSLGLRQHSAVDYLCYACVNYGQTSVFRVRYPFGAPDGDSPTMDPPPILPEVYATEIRLIRRYTQNLVFGLWDGAVSDIDPKVLLCGNESSPGISEDMIYIDSGPTIKPILETHSGCTGGVPPPACNTPLLPSPSLDRCPLKDPVPYSLHILGGAHWPDPDVAGIQWFLAGTQLSIPVIVDEDPVTHECRCLNYCGPNPAATPACICDKMPCVDFVWRSKVLTDPGRTLGYRLSRVDLTPTGQPPTGTSMAVDWWQVEVPDTRPDRTEATDLIRSVADPRVDQDGVPLLVHGTRNASADGWFLYRPRVLADAAQGTCNGEGKGQELTWEDTFVKQVTTHFELEGLCRPDAPNDDCAEATTRALTNSRSHTFEVTDPQGNALWVHAVATGFPASDPGLNDNEATCKWRRYAGQPMAVFYDVTETGDSFQAPRLLRVALTTLPGTPDPPVDARGSAWVITTKSYGVGPDARTFAFVGDLLGEFFVYDVSHDQLFAHATHPYIRDVLDDDGNGPNPGVPEPNPVLLPVAALSFPNDPYDGWNCNCLDLEQHGDYLYCALGRAGLGIVDISDPMQPLLEEVLDTPGLALGITLRPDPSGMQVIVGDSRCGVRIYQ